MKEHVVCLLEEKLVVFTLLNIGYNTGMEAGNVSSHCHESQKNRRIPAVVTAQTYLGQALLKYPK